MKLTQKNFDTLVNNLNYKMTNIEADIKWMKNLGRYLAGILTLIFAAIIGGAI